MSAATFHQRVTAEAALARSRAAGTIGTDYPALGELSNRVQSLMDTYWPDRVSINGHTYFVRATFGPCMLEVFESETARASLADLLLPAARLGYQPPKP